MIAVFSFPFAFWAFAAIPALIGIYLLQNRFRQHSVSSLIFWIDHKQATEGGVRLEKISTPLLFVIELLAILFLVFAAAGPLLRSKTDRSSFTVILDNSFSMLADTKPSPQERAIKDIEDIFKDANKFNASFILASRKPTLLATDVTSFAKMKELLSSWKCNSELSDLPSAVSLAKELSNNKSRIVIVTDRKPDHGIPGGIIEWRAYGKPVDNTAFVYANLTRKDGKYRCLLSVVNLSDSETSADLDVFAIKSDKRIISRKIDLAPKAANRLIFELSESSLPLVAKISNDPLNIDNEVMLLPERNKNIRVEIDLENELLKTSIEKALTGNTSVSLSDISPHLLITDSKDRQDLTADCWILRVLASEESNAYLGPFVVDQSHPLTDGLSLDGLIWAAQDKLKIQMQPLITAGNIPLMMINSESSGANEVFLNLNAELSTVTRSPNWPILLFNLVNWRISRLPGLEKQNYVSGLPVHFVAESGIQSVSLELPDGETRELAVLHNQLDLEPEGAGIYKIIEDQREHSFVVNTISQAESDLSDSVSGQWGTWDEAVNYWWEYQPVDWLLFVIVLGLLTLHRYITSKQLEGLRI